MRTPAFLMLVVLLGLSILAAASALFVAVNQPWLGVVLSPGDDGSVVISRVQRTDFEPNLNAGERLDAIGSKSTGSITVSAIDIVEEPDTLNSYEALNAFRVRQSALSGIQNQNRVWLDVTGASGGAHRVHIAPFTARPAWSLPFEFWLQLFVGCGGLVLGGWVWVLRRREAGPFYFFISGVGLMASALSAAIYGTRELSMPKDLLIVLSGINYAGTVSFGAAIICLLAVYPKRIASDRQLIVIWVATALATGITVGQLPLFQYLGIYPVMVVQFVAIGALIAIQLYLSQRNPVARAALGWFGLSILAGTSVFVFAIATPLLIGLEPQVSQASAFGVILLIYAGVALGVARYRLFDLDMWAFRLGSYFVGAMLLVGLDAFLIYGVAVERMPAFGIALLVVGLVYLPLRNAIGARLNHNLNLTKQTFPQLVEIALERTPDRQIAQWHTLLTERLNPLTIETAPTVPKVALVEDGQGLLIPGHLNLPSLILQFANGGRRLFSQRDVDQVQNLVDLITHAIDSSDAREQGVRQERTRIARDLHDNIGAQLLRTLHTPDLQRKNTIVSETLADLRDIISNAQGNGMALDEVLAELRYETNERLALAGLQLRWHYSGNADVGISARRAHTLRSVVRECASNTIRHAQATELCIEITEINGEIGLTVSDNGKGFDEAAPKRGRGLNNIYSRILGEGGSLSITGTAGTRIDACFPLLEGGLS
ncbi:sensor histidine kinase [Hoeflea sp. Naph1]|uniref:sensor histidine kinase n=1 Tax=Hoeflea sp. Naph1 TaxID=3388653 RepID=UPI00398FE003